MSNARPDFIVHWSAIEPAEPSALLGLDERFGYDTEFSPATGMTRLGLHHIRLTPGARSDPPRAERDEEEFVFVVEGRPDLWADGNLHRLRAGDAVGFPDRTGLAHAFLNNTDRDVRLFVMREAPRYESRLFHPLDAKANDALRTEGKLWDDPPQRRLGPHDALTNARRGRPGVPAKRRPDFVVNWRDILGKDNSRYPGSRERHGIDAMFGRHFRFSRLGVHFEILKPGRRTSWPHAERDEEEFVFVVSGALDIWIDGYLHPARTGDFIGFPSRTGITHVVINNSADDAMLIVGGEASRVRNQFFYPLHAKRNREIKKLLWADPPKRALGPHDGLPDALRAKARKRGKRAPKMTGGHRKRFYKTVEAVAGAEGTYAVALDGRSLKTPLLADLGLPNSRLAEAIAGEWRSQGAEILFHAMPLTRLAFTSVDRVGADRDAAIEQIVAFGNSDVVCYRAVAPSDLVERQAQTWNPLLQWARDSLGADLTPVEGVEFTAQPKASLARLRGAVAGLDDFSLAGIQAAAELCGSAVIALALFRGHLDPEAAFEAANLDELYQAEIWGDDPEARLRRAERAANLCEIMQFVQLTRES